MAKKQDASAKNTTMTEGETRGKGLAFHFNADSGKLTAAYQPEEDAGAIDSHWLQQRLEAEGFAQLHLIEPALAELIAQYNAKGEAFSLEIGEAIDGGASIQIAPDQMAAALTLTPAQGGRPVSAAQVYAALEAQGVTAGILHGVIEEAVKMQQAAKQLIAQGHEPVNGKDGYLQSLIPQIRDRHPQVDEHDIANYRELGGIVNVTPGDPLMQNIAPTLGEAGENVHGQVIPAQPGKPVLFATNLDGAAPNPELPDRLVATIAGQPVLVKDGAIVEPTVTLKTIDLSCGNVTFEGSIIITGDVHPGMTVQATGDIQVGGTVEAALLDAGGDIIVKGGVIGCGDARAEDATGIARLRCDGSVTARFIENAVIDAEDSIYIDELAVQSFLSAVNQIIVGKPGARKGHIIGGGAQATLLIQAQIIGSPANVKTRIEVGVTPYFYERAHQINNQLATRIKELENIGKALAFVQQHPGKVKPGTLEKALNTQTVLRAEIASLNEEREELRHHLELAEDAKIVVGKTIYSGVTVQFGHKSYPVDLEREGGTFSIEEGEITLH